MNPHYESRSYEKPRLFEREEKLRKSQLYKKKNQQHPAFKR